MQAFAEAGLGESLVRVDTEKVKSRSHESFCFTFVIFSLHLFLAGHCGARIGDSGVIGVVGVPGLVYPDDFDSVRIGLMFRTVCFENLF